MTFPESDSDSNRVEMSLFASEGNLQVSQHQKAEHGFSITVHPGRVGQRAGQILIYSVGFFPLSLLTRSTLEKELGIRDRMEDSLGFCWISLRSILGRRLQRNCRRRSYLPHRVMDFSGGVLQR